MYEEEKTFSPKIETEQNTVPLSSSSPASPAPFLPLEQSVPPTPIQRPVTAPSVSHSFKSKLLAPHHYSHKHFPWIFMLVIIVIIGLGIYAYITFFRDTERSRMEREIEIGRELIDARTNPTEVEKENVVKKFEDKQPEEPFTTETDVINFLNS